MPSGVQSRNVVARHRRATVGRERGEIAADQELPVRLHDRNPHQTIRVWIEAIECRVSIDVD